MRELLLSVVSHGHGEMVRALLHQLAACHAVPACVVLTLNLPEPELLSALQADEREHPWPFDLRVQSNPVPLGFGANHNQAFALHALPHWQAQGLPLEHAVFGVINPDIGLQDEPFAPLMQALQAEPACGCVYPRQVDAQGRVQDAERLLPTPASIAKRVVWHVAARLGVSRMAPPGRPNQGQGADWVNGAFLLIKAIAWQAVQGFDTRYFMYVEDVDLCLRLQLAGWRLMPVPHATVVHEAQRNSRRSLQHVMWHVGSLFRLWRSPSYRSYRRIKL